MTVTTTPAAQRKAREITVAYLGELLFNAGFIHERQRDEVDAVDRHFKAQVRGSKTRSEDEASPFKARMAMHVTDASGTGTRMDDFLLARLIAAGAGKSLYKVDAQEPGVGMT